MKPPVKNSAFVGTAMRFYERCGVVDPFRNFSRVADYIAELFSLSHTVPVFIATEPAVIATRVEGVMRRVAIAPGYTILCSRRVLENFNTVYMLAEPTWIESGVLIPYTASKPCSERPHRYGIALDVDERIGLLHLCSRGIEDSYIPELISLGGLVELSGGDSCRGEGVLRFIPVKNRFFFNLKGLGVGTVHRAVRYTLYKVDIPPKLEALALELAKVDDAPALIAIGKGYLAAFEALIPIEEQVYPPLLMTVYTSLSSEARARYYIDRLEST